MTREEAIKVLEAEKKFLFHGSLSDKHYEPAFDMAIEALKAQQWISCSERLPSAEHNLEGFLTTLRYCDITDTFMLVYENGKFGHWDGEKLIPNDDVIAWMEIPEPYMEEES